ncbi:MAG: spermidine synthase [Planctomycetaceae bacterium]
MSASAVAMPPADHRSWRASAIELLPFATATLLGAFLVFQVQPIISKCVLPWFGGTSAVWTTCMLFFQLLLFGGYVYAHLLRTYAKVKLQALVHVSLLLVALATLPIEPSAAWKPAGDGSPTLHLLWLLSAHVGLPYFVLSSTGPLMQAWLSLRINDDRVYRLYALSNAGSLAALLSYPFLVEPWLSVTAQSSLWSWLFACFVIVQSIVLIRSVIDAPAIDPVRETEMAQASDRERLSIARKAGWIGLAALASTLLLTTTNHVCQDVAVIPFLWVLPLSLYLISFIICFDSATLYHPKLYAAIALAALVCMQLSKQLGASGQLLVDALASMAFLFFLCMLCHGEVARLKPSVGHLTQYYALLSAGGAIGGIIVAVICPLMLNDYSEQAIATTLGASLALVMLFAARNWGGRIYGWRAVRQVRLAIAVLPLVSIGAAASYSLPGLIESDRNFFGVLRVEEQDGDRCLVHGTTVHGLQRSAPFDGEPTTYYGRQSGIGRALAVHGMGRPLEVGVIGLGCGVLAAYGREGDRYDFIEINPAIIRVADEHFTFVRRSDATIVNHLGDGRLVMDQMQSRRFDVIVLDAFSSDSIPAHLLTREAMALYRSRLSDDGVIAVHVSNKHLDLGPLVHRLAADTGLVSKLVDSKGDSLDRTLPALWVIVADDAHAIWQHEEFKTLSFPEPAAIRAAPLWSDQQHNLWSVFRTPTIAIAGQ